MFTANIAAFVALSVALAILSIITLILASRHDKVVALAGPIEEEKGVLARIEEKRATLNDLEEELAKRREALANLGPIMLRRARRWLWGAPRAPNCCARSAAISSRSTRPKPSSCRPTTGLPRSRADWRTAP